MKSMKHTLSVTALVMLSTTLATLCAENGQIEASKVSLEQEVDAKEKASKKSKLTRSPSVESLIHDAQAAINQTNDLATSDSTAQQRKATLQTLDEQLKKVSGKLSAKQDLYLIILSDDSQSQDSLKQVDTDSTALRQALMALQDAYDAHEQLLHT